jgi:hypothetical protein
MSVYTPDQKFNPIYQDEITARTRIAHGISMARFLGGYGDRFTLDHLSQSNRLKLAKQYVLQSDVIKLVSENMGDFSDYRLVVAEGYYRPGPEEALTRGSTNYYLANGQAVVYELIDENGKTAVEATFDLSVYFKENLNFEKMILDYDTYSPDGELNAQIIMIMPLIVPPWTVTYQNNLETRFNNYVQSTDELIEILAE